MDSRIYRGQMDRGDLRLRRVVAKRRCRRAILVLIGWIYRSIRMRGTCRISCRWRWKIQLGLGRNRGGESGREREGEQVSELRDEWVSPGRW